MRMILLGAPGSGKGTQGEKLAAAFRLPRISTGDALRAAVQSGSALGIQARQAMEAGELVADELVVAIVEERLARPDAEEGFILDGFPRNAAQARRLDALLRRLGAPPVDLALDLEVPGEELVRRLLMRAAEGRADDRAEVIRNRIRVYAEQTRPLLDYYAAQGKLVAVAGTGGVDEVFQRVLAKLARAVRPAPGEPALG